MAPAALPGASFDGAMVLGAVSSGLPAYALQITDSSLFVFTNINVDTAAVGSTSAANVFVAGVAINSAPDDLSAKAFAPTQFVLGLVRQAKLGPNEKFVFVPETDSVVIGGKRYMLSIIELGALTDDPTQRPYPPNFWPDQRYWQFANRHNPYLDIRYQGETEDNRIAGARADTQAIAQTLQQAQEPLQMYLDTNGMVVWPILGFPLTPSASPSTAMSWRSSRATSSASWRRRYPPRRPPALVSPRASVVLPGAATQQNPYTMVLISPWRTRQRSLRCSHADGSASVGDINGIVVRTPPRCSLPPHPAWTRRCASKACRRSRQRPISPRSKTGPQVEILQQQLSTARVAGNS